MTRACTQPPRPVRLKVGLVLAFLLGRSPLGALEAPALQADLAVPPAAATTSVALVTEAKRAEEIRGTINVGKNMTERGDYVGAEIAFRQVLNAPDASPGAGISQAKSRSSAKSRRASRASSCSSSSSSQ